MNSTTPPNWVLWSTVSAERWYLIPNGTRVAEGSATLRDRAGHVMNADAFALVPFEITQDQALHWAKDELGQTLEDLKHGIDERLANLREQISKRNRTRVAAHTTLTPNAAPALFEFLKQLPGVIVNSLAHDAQRVESAKTTMADLQRRLKEAGIDLDQRFTAFPERLAQLREDERKRQP